MGRGPEYPLAVESNLLMGHHLAYTLECTAVKVVEKLFHGGWEAMPFDIMLLAGGPSPIPINCAGGRPTPLAIHTTLSQAVVKPFTKRLQRQSLAIATVGRARLSTWGCRQRSSIVLLTSTSRAPIADKAPGR